MATRADFLGRIRAEVAKTPGRFEAQTATRPPRPDEAAEAVRRQMAERWPEALERFRQEFERVAGVFHRVKTVAEVPAAVLAIAREKSAREVVAWDAAMLGLDLRPALAAAGLAVGDGGSGRQRRGGARFAIGPRRPAPSSASRASTSPSPRRAR